MDVKRVWRRTSCWMWRRVAGYKYTDVSNNSTASIFKMWNFAQMDVVLSSERYAHFWHNKGRSRKRGNFCVHLCEGGPYLSHKEECWIVSWLRRLDAGLTSRGSGMSDLWSKKCHYDRFKSQHFSFPLSVSFRQCSILIHSSVTDATQFWNWQTRTKQRKA